VPKSFHDGLSDKIDGNLVLVMSDFQIMARLRRFTSRKSQGDVGVSKFGERESHLQNELIGTKTSASH
jgi:hypothetical protein